MTFATYVLQSHQQIFSLLVEHIQLTATAVGLALFVGIPLGLTVSYMRRLSGVVLGAVNIIQAIPSMALLGAVIPLLGIGKLPAIVIVALYSLLPIVKNTYTGLGSIPPQTVEAAKGIGLTRFQVLTRVQLPLAFPVIMAGVRIAAVTAVGLVTIAAFIGAGGLGFLVFSGISTVNNNLILAGAIPACALALLVDYLGSWVETRMQPARRKSPAAHAAMGSPHALRRKKIRMACAAVLVLLALGAGMARFGTAENTIVIGGKDFTEQHILPHLLAKLIEEKTDITVERRINLGGTQVCFAALRNNEIDMYVEYSGTAYGDTLGYPAISDMQHVYDTVKKDFSDKFAIVVLPQMRFNNTYALAVKQTTADAHKLVSISDLAPVAKNLNSASSFEFLNRDDGLPGLSKTYGFTFKESFAMNGSQRYIAIESDDVEVIDAFSTDGLLKKFNLVLLEDDKNFFPPYYAIPLIRQETLDTYPEIGPLVEQLGQVLTNERMIEMNYRVDQLQMNPELVADEFLRDNGLI